MSTNNSPIYEHPEPVCFELDNDSKKEKVDQFLDWIYRQYGEEMYNFFRANYDGILENKVPREYEGFCRGTRLSKALMKKFGVTAEDVRQKLSMLIQSNKITGTLCLSVHPLDFLSASENNHSWRSCHALDGEYRVGNVSYMLDDCTFIAYLKSNKDTKLPHFPDDVPWNDKKWRCYFYIDRLNNIVYAARQYPFFSEKALMYVADILRRKLGFFWDAKTKQTMIDNVKRGWWFGEPRDLSWEEYSDEYLSHSRFMPTGIKGEVMINGYSWYFENTKLIVGGGSSRKIVPVTNYIETDRDACCFNDVIQSHTYAPWTLYYGDSDNSLPTGVHTKLIVGRGVKCVCCGSSYTADSDIFTCNSCRHDEQECCRCGCMDRADYMHYADGEWYCADCWDELNSM